jgi:phage replication-related protein YjqB (UPF0714/DUF867 family)
MADKYSNFASLRAEEVEGVDFRIVEYARSGAETVVIAPHGGAIEAHTSDIARQIAGLAHSYYAFEGTKRSANRNLHITSHNFDEPRALKIVSAHKRVLAVHGCMGEEQIVYVGGRDLALVSRLMVMLEAFGIASQASGHAYLGVSPSNICNRGQSGAGVQLELPMPLRRGEMAMRIIKAAQQMLDGTGCE